MQARHSTAQHSTPFHTRENVAFLSLLSLSHSRFDSNRIQCILYSLFGIPTQFCMSQVNVCIYQCVSLVYLCLFECFGNANSVDFLNSCQNHVRLLLSPQPFNFTSMQMEMHIKQFSFSCSAVFFLPCTLRILETCLSFLGLSNNIIANTILFSIFFLFFFFVVHKINK